MAIVAASGQGANQNEALVKVKRHINDFLASFCLAARKLKSR